MAEIPQGGAIASLPQARGRRQPPRPARFPFPSIRFQKLRFLSAGVFRKFPIASKSCKKFPRIGISQEFAPEEGAIIRHCEVRHVRPCDRRGDRRRGRRGVPRRDGGRPRDVERALRPGDRGRGSTKATGGGAAASGPTGPAGGGAGSAKTAGGFSEATRLSASASGGAGSAAARGGGSAASGLSGSIGGGEGSATRRAPARRPGRAIGPPPPSRPRPRASPGRRAT